jgi:hypothetical protein
VDGVVVPDVGVRVGWGVRVEVGEVIGGEVGWNVGSGVRVGWGLAFPLAGLKGLGLLSMTIQAAEVNKTATTTNAITVIVFNSIQPR